MQIPVVENPRRRRRHRKLSAKQIAAGFGGKRRTHRRHHRNPGLAALMANPRRRRYSRRASPRRHRRYRNPGLLGGLGLGMFDMKSALYVTGGIAVAKLAPGLLVKVWAGAPTTGIGRYGIQLASVFLAATGVRMVTKSSQAGSMVMAGGVAAVAYDMLNEWVFPKIGLAGLGDDYSPVSRSELVSIGVDGYQTAPRGVGTYQTTEQIMSI